MGEIEKSTIYGNRTMGPHNGEEATKSAEFCKLKKPRIFQTKMNQKTKLSKHTNSRTHGRIVSRGSNTHMIKVQPREL